MSRSAPPGLALQITCQWQVFFCVTERGDAFDGSVLDAEYQCSRTSRAHPRPGVRAGQSQDAAGAGAVGDGFVRQSILALAGLHVAAAAVHFHAQLGADAVPYKKTKNQRPPRIFSAILGSRVARKRCATFQVARAIYAGRNAAVASMARRSCQSCTQSSTVWLSACLACRLNGWMSNTGCSALKW